MTNFIDLTNHCLAALAGMGIPVWQWGRGGQAEPSTPPGAPMPAGSNFGTAEQACAFFVNLGWFEGRRVFLCVESKRVAATSRPQSRLSGLDSLRNYPCPP